jgi:uncharacterized Zn finger protein (UPF0148 family)
MTSGDLRKDDPMAKKLAKDEVEFSRRSITPCPKPKCKSFRTRVYASRGGVHYMVCGVCDHHFKAVHQDERDQFEKAQAAQRRKALKEDVTYSEAVRVQAESMFIQAREHYEKATLAAAKSREALAAENKA